MFMHSARSAIGFAATVFLSMTLHAPLVSGDTAHIRGPNYDGIDSTSRIALPWPKDGPTVLWRRPIGQGYSGFVIVGDKAYTQMQGREGQRLICLDLHTGETLWETRYNWPWLVDNDWPGPYATPTYSDGRVFFAGARGVVGCADAKNGDLIWSRNVLEEFNPRGVNFGYASTPLVILGKVYLPLGGKGASVIALDAQTGAVAWQTGSDEASYSPCIPAVTGGSTQIVSYLSTATVAHDPHTGKELWRQRWGGGYSPHGTWPIYREPYLFRTHPFKRGCRVDRIVKSDSGTALELVWLNKEICADFLSPVLTETAIFGFDVRTPQADRDGNTRGSFACLDFKTGDTLWRTNAVSHASVQVCDGNLLIMNEEGELIDQELESFDTLIDPKVFWDESGHVYFTEDKYVTITTQGVRMTTFDVEKINRPNSKS
jgi:outer membrane protein assembly factor BamB